MDREYIIAGFRIRLEQADRLFVRPGSHMARAFEPFAAEADPAAPLTMRLIPDCTINKKLTGGEPNRELDVFPFDDYNRQNQMRRISEPAVTFRGLSSLKTKSD